MCSIMGYIGSGLSPEEFRAGFERTKSRGPDMSRVLPDMVRKELPAGGAVTAEQAERLVQETCRAEVVHGASCLLGLACLWLWPGWGGAAQRPWTQTQVPCQVQKPPVQKAPSKGGGGGGSTSIGGGAQGQAMGSGSPIWNSMLMLMTVSGSGS